MPKGIKGFQKGHHPKSEFKKGVSSWNKGKNATTETKEKSSKSHEGLNAGSKHPNWQGGKTKRYKHTTGTRKYRVWRISVFQRDNWTCQICMTRSRGGIIVFLEAHHIKLWAKYPKLRFELSNGITLCKECHKLIHKKYMEKNKLDTDIKTILDDKDFFCEKCEQELPVSHFTMDENGEVCDSCMQNAGDMAYESWREREPESDMTGATEGDR